MTTAESNQFSLDAWEANAQVWDERMGNEANDFFKINSRLNAFKPLYRERRIGF